MHYRRAKTPGATYFFTVNLADRSSDLLVQRINLLRSIINKVKHAHPFVIEAMVVLPEHCLKIGQLMLVLLILAMGKDRRLPHKRRMPVITG